MNQDENDLPGSLELGRAAVSPARFWMARVSEHLGKGNQSIENSSKCKDGSYKPQINLRGLCLNLAIIVGLVKIHCAAYRRSKAQRSPETALLITPIGFLFSMYKTTSQITAVWRDHQSM